jgi:hypothetical protein
LGEGLTRLLPAVTTEEDEEVGATAAEHIGQPAAVQRSTSAQRAASLTLLNDIYYSHWHNDAREREERWTLCARSRGARVGESCR